MGEAAETDTDLMLRVKRGDLAAFEELVNKYKQPVINMVHRTLQDATEAEDIAQNVFIQVYKSAGRYQPSAKFSTWLFTIARNLCLNEIRRRMRHPADPLPSAEEDDLPHRQLPDKSSPAPPEALLDQELEEKIQAALLQLPDNQRIAILLCRQEELSYEEIAEVLGCSLSATKSLIHRGREQLKAALKPYLATGRWQKK